MGKILAFRPGYAKWDQNSQFLPLSETQVSPSLLCGGYPSGTPQKKRAPVLWRNLKVFRFYYTAFCTATFSNEHNKILLFHITVQNSMLYSLYRFSVQVVLAMLCSGCSNNRRFDGKRATRWKRRPQGTHKAYPCITWCSWLFISSD